MQLFGKFFGNKKQTATFSSSATLEKPNIKGGDYDAIDTGDGYYTIKNVLFFAEVPKGEKGAPEDVKKDRMAEMVGKAVAKYEKESFAAPTHRGHHKAIAFEDPEFLGFELPKYVGRTTLDGKEQDAVYGDLKVKASAFERIHRGELPYLSPEVDWDSWQFSSVALLDSMPPHFKGPLLTIGKVTKDPKAKFTVGATISKGQFMAFDSKSADQDEEKADEGKRHEELKRVKDDEKTDSKSGGKSPKQANDHGAVDGDTYKKKSDGHIDGQTDDPEEHDDAKMCAHCMKKMSSYEHQMSAIDKTMADIHFRMGLPYKGAQMEQKRATGKPVSGAPAEDDKAKEPKEDSMTKFSDDPEALAKFAAQDAKLKALEDKLTSKEADEAKKARVTAAFEELKGYPLTQVGKDGIAQFADSPEKLKTFIEVLKAQTPKDPPRSVSEFESSGKEVKVEIAGNDPDLASFQAKGQEAMEAALKYAARFEAMKQDKTCKNSELIRKGRKEYIEFMMELDSSGNFGRKKVS